ncbi:MAG: undecaprenyl-phosphate glucose phosphotransferase [Clostridiales bacterium]|nr:undecaprenyl-phosphate glucose phosphotransferase [Clostridiales bacterium]
MIRKNQKLMNFLNAVSDGFLVLFAYAFSSWLWLDVIKDDRNMASLDQLGSRMGITAVIYAVCVVLVLACFHMYRTSRLAKPTKGLKKVLVANAISLVSAAALLYLFRLEDFSRGVLALFYITSCALLIVKRLLMRWLLRSIRARGYNLKHVVVIGGGELADRYVKAITADEALGMHVKEVIRDMSGLDAKMEKLLHNAGVDEVVAALEPNELGFIVQIIQNCEKCGTKISIVPSYNDVIPTKPTINVVGDLKLIQLRTTPLDEPLNAFLKRAFDIVASLILIVLSSPLMLLAVIGVKLTSPGPVLFRQERVGLNKEHFTMLKFRSMRVNDKETTGWSTEKDPRRTKFGSFIRKTSIDELPQLFNTLKGDMSLVGPRPEIPFFVEQFRETIPLYMVKNQVRPGITGWAQVNGYRGDTSIEERIKHDLWYIENWSLSLDILILFRTAFGGMINKEKN